MVSKLEVLSRYYQIYIDTIKNGYFSYEDMSYYLSDNGIDQEQELYYQKYVYIMQVRGFQVIKNCFGHIQSEGYVLYAYEIEPYSLDTIVYQSMQIITNEYHASLKEIKNSWCRIIDDARRQVSKYAARMNHNEYYVILSYYYQGVAENIIVMINEVLEYFVEDSLPLGYEHSYFSDSYDVLFNPDNLIISTRVRDLALAYQNGSVTVQQLENYVSMYYFSPLEITYLYLRILFPSHFFKLVANNNVESEQLRSTLITCYQQLGEEKKRIIAVYTCLSKYVQLPMIPWLMQSS